jgi:hypothetical protein
MPLEAVRDCAAKVAPAVSGIKDLGAQCPQLEESLQALGLQRMLYDGWQEHLNRDALQDLVQLARQYGGSKPGDSPNLAALPGILKALEREQTPLPKSWWDAVKAWFKIWWSQHSDSLNWLERWLERVGRSTTLFDVISYSLVAIVLMAAVAVIANELKAGGSFRRGRRVRRTVPGLNPAADISDADAGESGALTERLTALLRTLVARLVQTRRLETERSLTHRELVARGVFDSESQRAVFAAVAGAAESIVYGANGPAAEQLSGVLHEGRVLLSQLSDAPGAP